MKLAIMQPYLFPYIGYFQLINAVDELLIFDDVQYIKRGWINRNRLLLNKSPKLFSLPLKKKHLNSKINECELISIDQSREKLLNMLLSNYRKAPYFSNVFSLIEEIFKTAEKNIAIFNLNSLKGVMGYLDINTKLLLS